MMEGTNDMSLSARIVTTTISLSAANINSDPLLFASDNAFNPPPGIEKNTGSRESDVASVGA